MFNHFAQTPTVTEIIFTDDTTTTYSSTDNDSPGIAMGVWYSKIRTGSTSANIPFGTVAADGQRRSVIPFVVKFPPGSWEHAVACTYHDAHNQLGRGDAVTGL